MGQLRDIETWTEFKALLQLKQAKIQEFSLLGGEYTTFFTENTDTYRVSFTQASADGTDYETNFQPTANERTENPVTVENTVNVASANAGDDFRDYLDHGTVLAGLTSVHTIVVPAATTYRIRQLILTGTGQWKAEIAIDGSPIGTVSGSMGSPCRTFEFPIDVEAAETFTITFTNLEPSRSQCFYSTFVAGSIT